MSKVNPVADSPSNVLSFAKMANLSAKHKLSLAGSSRQNGDLKTGNRGNLHVLPFSKTAHVRRPKGAQGLNGKVGATAARVLKAEARAQIRARIADVATVLNLSSKVIKPAMSTKHENLAAFAKKHGIKIEWLIAGTGRVFRWRGELFEGAIEFERLLRIEKDLRARFYKSRSMRDRLAYEKLGLNPDDRETHAAAIENLEAWLEATNAAEREIPSSKDWSAWSRAVSRRVKAGKELRKFSPPSSQLGLLVRLRTLEVIEDQDGVAALIMAEIRAFFARRRAGKIAAD